MSTCRSHYKLAFADRAKTLSVDDSGGAQSVVSAANGPPWGALGWSYDKIGNRLSEDRNGSVESYGYLSNGSGNTAILTQAGTRTYTTGPAGHVTGINAGGNPIDLAVDDEGRVAGFARSLASAQTSMRYAYPDDCAHPSRYDPTRDAAEIDSSHGVIAGYSCEDRSPGATRITRCCTRPNHRNQ